MCECGCTMNNEAYRLPGGKGFFYLLEMYAGCRDCDAGPAVLVRRITPDTIDYDEAKDAPLLPFFTVSGLTECPITLGLTPDEFVKAATPSINGYTVGGRTRLDKDDAYEIAQEVWQEAVRRRPELIRVTHKAD